MTQSVRQGFSKNQCRPRFFSAVRSTFVQKPRGVGGLDVESIPNTEWWSQDACRATARAKRNEPRPHPNPAGRPARVVLAQCILRLTGSSFAVRDAQNPTMVFCYFRP